MNLSVKGQTSSRLRLEDSSSDIIVNAIRRTKEHDDKGAMS